MRTGHVHLVLKDSTHYAITASQTNKTKGFTSIKFNKHVTN